MQPFIAFVLVATTTFGATLYVTPDGAGNKNGSDWGNAFAGIQAAVDAADAAFAADATIHEILVTNGVYSRVVIQRDYALTVRSVNGAESTVIDGAGTNNCISAIERGHYAVSPEFEGFTLRNGDVEHLADGQDNGGGAAGTKLVDCIIEDCRAWKGGATYATSTTRCIIRRCVAMDDGGAVCAGIHRNTLIHDCTSYDAVIYYAELYNCTVADNETEFSNYNFIYNSTARNCIFWNNTADGSLSTANDAQDPRFVGHGDYRLRLGSPAFNGGDNHYTNSNYVGETDLAGNARVQDGVIDRGCYEGTALEGTFVLASADGNGAVSPEIAFLRAGTSVTITADTSKWHRDAVEWSVNGVVVAGATGNSLTITVPDEEVSVVARFSTLEWFVDGTSGSDSGHDGRTAATAFKTIQKAIDSAAPGESIHVAAGLYDPIDASRFQVSVVGAGRDKTVIDGGDTNRCAHLGERGQSLIQGFTLRNGRFMSVSIDPADGEGGGGAKGGTLVDCTITNCVSMFGGGVFDGELIRCIVADCSAHEGGGVIMGTSSNCLFVCNYADWGGGASQTELRGCTVAGNRAAAYAAVNETDTFGCIFNGNKSANGRTNYNYGMHDEESCCFDEEREHYNGSFTADPMFVDPENGDFRLRADSPCIGLGCYEGYVTDVPDPPAPPGPPSTIVVSGGGSALQDAINAASDGDRLLVSAGVYGPIDASGKVLDIVSAAGPANTFIRGTPTTRAVTFSPTMTRRNSTISGFTIEGGTSTNLVYGGGGVLGGTISNCVIRGNSAFVGGGVAQAYVTHSVISNNTASVAGGGAAASWLDTCLVVRNAANVNLSGYDLSPYGGGVPDAEHNMSGGGGMAFSAANYCTITRNSSSTYAGGAVFAVLDSTYLAGNTAEQEQEWCNAVDFPCNPRYVCSTAPTFPDTEGFVDAAADDTFVDPGHDDYHIKATSGCVEGGNPDDLSRRDSTDLDGVFRWRGTASDIGCYESPPIVPPAVPGVEATRGTNRTDVLVTWEPTRGAEWYTVHRSINNSFNATPLARVDPPMIAYIDTTALRGTNYHYWVVAHSTAGDGPAGDGVHGYWVSELAVTTESLPNGMTRVVYTAGLTATGGMPPYTWTVTRPTWLAVSGSTISGMPRGAGKELVIVVVSDASGQEVKKMLDLTIEQNTAPLGPAKPYAGECYEGNYLIENFDQLRLFEGVLHNEDGTTGSYFEGSTFTLTADIDCGGRAFVPTNGEMYAFKGTFDGANHRIYNFSNDVHTCGSLIGVSSSGAVVKNVTLEGYIRLTTLWGQEGESGSVELSQDWGAAAISEYVYGSTSGTPGLTIQNCHFTGTVVNDENGEFPNKFAGGLVGQVDNDYFYSTNAPADVTNLVIVGSSVTARVDAAEWAGGLVALGWGVDVLGCAVTGQVHRAAKLGGLGGHLGRSSFRSCSFDGEVRTQDFISGSPYSGGGGLIGVAEDVHFKRCSASGLVDWEYYVSHDSLTDESYYERTDIAYNFTASGGAAGLTLGDTAFFDCSFEGTLQSTNGFFGGFVGWTSGAETFSNCSARVVCSPDGMHYPNGTGGFAGIVASHGAQFMDCSAEQLGGVRILGGFFDRQTPCDGGESVGTNYFFRCSAKNMKAQNGGFCTYAWNAAFKDCTVRGGSAGAGFVRSAGQVPGEGYAHAQTSTFEDCSVVGVRAHHGFVFSSNPANDGSSTNVFRRCRAGCALESSDGGDTPGFADVLNNGTLVEDCAAYGVSVLGVETYGFAYKIGTGATVRRSVGAVLSGAQENRGAGFAQYIADKATVEDCYSVYAPTAPQSENPHYGSTYGVQAGFVRYTHIGYNEDDYPVTRCFALGALPDATANYSYSGSFCGVTPYGSSTRCFEGCYRPAWTAVGDVDNHDVDGVDAFTRKQFADATSATMPNYDFTDIWRVPNDVASSPYLAASTDAYGRFWFQAVVVSGFGHILVDGGEPAESYAAGARIKVKAVSDDATIPFSGWVGEGFDDPLAQETYYTVKNVSAIGATFGTTIYTCEDFASIPDNATGSYVLMNDLDFGNFDFNNDTNQFRPIANFKGRFFGQGHVISNIVWRSGEFTETYAPFASMMNGAEVRDLTICSSNVPGNTNTLCLAGLVVSVGSGVVISNCHVVADWRGTYPAWFGPAENTACQYYGLARMVDGADIHIVDCSVEGRLVGATEACGFVGEAAIAESEIARCAVLAEVCATVDAVGGLACGFADSIILEGGATLRECFTAGIVDGACDASGFANEIYFNDASSSMSDCYSTMEVKAGYYAGNDANAYGIAGVLSGYDDSEPNLVTNVWFGGTVRGGYHNYAFADIVEYVTLANCRHVAVDDAPMQGTDGVTALAGGASCHAAVWAGFDFANTWSMTEGATTPYFAWSLAGATSTAVPGFRIFADAEPGITITHPHAVEPGAAAAIFAASETPSKFFCSWTGAATYTSTAVNPSEILADNHRVVRCVWGAAITNAAGLAAITNDLSGTYALGADIDLAGENWTPIGDASTAFKGSLYGNGYVISNLTVNAAGGSNVGLFGCLNGATISGVRLVDARVVGGGYAGALVGRAAGSSIITKCSVVGAAVSASGDRAGLFAGQLSGGSSVSKSFAIGSLSSSRGYVGGFTGHVEGRSSLSECFALGDVATTYATSYIGGFAGYVTGNSTVSDCYTLATVKGSRYVGGFVGYVYNVETRFVRCYAAGWNTEGGSRDVGSFAGYQTGPPIFADCVRPDDGLTDFGSSDHDGIITLDAAGMLATNNFSAFLAAGCWSQIDGITQPYFEWSLAPATTSSRASGGFILHGQSSGTGGGSVESRDGEGAVATQFAPGSVASVAASSTEGFFVAWTGPTPYADRTTATTTIALDNHRVASAWFGRLIHTADELDAVRNDLSGVYGLGADIDLAGRSWTPIGSGSAKFTGRFHGFGHSIAHMVATNNPTAQYRGLFGCTSGATLDGINLSGTIVGRANYAGGLVGSAAATRITDCRTSCVVSNSSYYTGGLVGRVEDGTAISNCLAAGVVLSTSSYAGGLAGEVSAQALVDGCSFEGAVTNSGQYTGGFVGHVVGSPCISRSYFSGVVAQTGTSSCTGGFVGYHEGGRIMDCYAIADVTAHSAESVGGFAGRVSKGTIAAAWCAGAVVTDNKRYTGAFAGDASVDRVARSYYDSGRNGEMQAAGTSTLGGSAAYDGISPLTPAQMLYSENFDFDFHTTWKIDEGVTTPYLRVFLVPQTDFAAWLQEYNLPADTDPLTVTNGISLVARYIYGVVPMSSVTDAEGNPMLRIAVDSSGVVRLQLPSKKNSVDFPVTFTIMASPDLSDWSPLTVTEFPVNLDTGVCTPVFDPVPRQMFFKCKVSVERE
jgi:hypothetical protein